MRFIGCDPGASGGIAVIGESIVTQAWSMPDTPKDLLLLLQELRDGDPTAFVEKVHAGPKMASSAAFKFGRNCGLLEMALLAAHIRIEYITPQRWQKELGLIVKGRGFGQGDTEKKNRNKAKAQEIFPSIKITHAIADALLIAHYGWRLCSMSLRLGADAESESKKPF